MLVRRAAAAVAVGGTVYALGRLLAQRRPASAASSLRKLIMSGKKALCVGKNYRAHITELAQLGPEWKLEQEPEPVLFLKPTSAYAWPGEPLKLPPLRPTLGLVPQTKHGVHHEVDACPCRAQVRESRSLDALRVGVSGVALAFRSSSWR